MDTGLMFHDSCNLLQGQGRDDEGNEVDMTSLSSSDSFREGINDKNNVSDIIDGDCIPKGYNDNASESSPLCFWSMFHFIVAHYLCFMILWNYLQTTFTSPGVLVPQRKGEECNNNDVNMVDDTNENNVTRTTWKSTEGRGGCCYINPTFNIQDEISRVALYKDAVNKECFPSSESNSVFIPPANTSFCKKCQMERPPRCHHCSTCNRCVLQMDHHCIWINNCIGYNNYRTFLLTLFYLVVGCWYGVSILCIPFYETIVQNHPFYHEFIAQIQHVYSHDASGSYLSQLASRGSVIKEFLWKNRQTSGDFMKIFVNLPKFTPMGLFRTILNESSSGVDPEIVLQFVFPFLLLTGTCLSSFFWSHCTYVYNSVTTLERMATLRFLKEQALLKLRHNNSEETEFSDESSNGSAKMMTEKASKIWDRSKLCEIKIVNPFQREDSGVLERIRQIMGKSLLLALLPVHVDAPPPYLPEYRNKAKFE